MGKKQHQKDKMYLTTTEWSQFYGGYKASSHSGALANFRRLPLTHCALSLQPFNHPYCDNDGNIFELEALLPFLNKFKVNPVNGKPLNEKNLVKLKFHKDSEEKIQCPVLYKDLTANSHVVAIKTSGNVFSYEAIDQLNIKTKNWRDLLTEEPFKRDDIIVLQNPQNLDKFNIAKFFHIKNDLKIENEELVKSRSDANLRLKNVSQDAKIILDEYSRTCKAEDESKDQDKSERLADKFNAAHYSTGKVAASFTSTTIDVVTDHLPAVLEDDVVRYSRVKKKGYVTLKTNFGVLNLELYCNAVPKTCENFIRLCDKGYYNGTKFHRSIRHFMLQGGDPTGTGKGGESCWGGKFKDEIKPQFSHKGRGVLSMANSGPDSNGSQFFLTYRSCGHLDGKHTIFGRVVGGLGTLSAIEAIETDNKDRPIEDVLVGSTMTFVNPFKEVDEELMKVRLEELKKKQQEEAELKGGKRKKPDSTAAPKLFRSGVGKFLDLSKATASKDEIEAAQSHKKKKEINNKLDAFNVF